jgi:hypothetical protein
MKMLRRIIVVFLFPIVFAACTVVDFFMMAFWYLWKGRLYTDDFYPLFIAVLTWSDGGYRKGEFRWRCV